MSKSQSTARPDPLAEAIVHEEAIAAEAAEIRGEATDLDPALFLKLWPLLRRPIPAGFIVSTPAVKGKPYESTGIKSLQVQIDRMNNVLTPLGWSHEVRYMDEGSLAEVIVTVGDRLLSRSSYGGVNQASTTGNRYKGSETNAAKRAFAAVGPGHEVYLGAVDLDPDVSEDAAKAQEQTEQPPAVQLISGDDAARLVDTFQQSGADTQALKLKLGSMGVPTPSVNRAFASLTPTQAAEIDGWISEQKVEKS